MISKEQWDILKNLVIQAEAVKRGFSSKIKPLKNLINRTPSEHQEIVKLIEEYLIDGDGKKIDLAARKVAMLYPYNIDAKFVENHYWDLLERG